jgi:hypothetical protein
MKKTSACIWLSPVDRATSEGWIPAMTRRRSWSGGPDRAAVGRPRGHDDDLRLVGKSKVTVARWQERYLAKGIAGLRRDATRAQATAER